MKVMGKDHLAVFFLFTALFSALPVSAEQEFLSAEEKAERSHQLAESDVMYQQEDYKALYYQNVAIIQLLKEIREEMHAINVRDAKDSAKT